MVQLSILLDANLMPHLLKMKHSISPRSYELKRALFLDTFALVSVEDFKSQRSWKRFQNWLLERHEEKRKRNDERGKRNEDILIEEKLEKQEMDVKSDMKKVRKTPRAEFKVIT